MSTASIVPEVVGSFPMLQMENFSWACSRVFQCLCVCIFDIIFNKSLWKLFWHQK